MESGASPARRDGAQAGLVCANWGRRRQIIPDANGPEPAGESSFQCDVEQHRPRQVTARPKRIDELADFAEWLANATPQDEEAIRAEIKRYFSDVGWQAAADDLNSKLSVILRSGVTPAIRQSILNSIDLYTRVDPAEYVGTRDFLNAAVLAGTGLLGGGAGASCWSIYEKDGVFQIEPFRVHPRGYWAPDRDRFIEFQAGTAVDEVIDRMIAVLQDAA
ncbi:MAG: hypothetical protein WBD53_14840 [Xanthobacteraceae bacterium]